MPEIATVVESLTTNRAQFASVFLKAQDEAAVAADRRAEFEVVALGLPDGKAFAETLAYAKEHCFFEALIALMVRDGLDDGRLIAALLKEREPIDAELHATVNRDRGFGQPHVVYRGFGDGLRWTVKIRVNGTAMGTGVLIREQLVLTAWHVVRDLFTGSSIADYQPVADGQDRLQVEFDDFLARIGRGGVLRSVTPLPVRAHADWCVAFSPCHPDELKNRLPTALNQLQNHWDYAIIKLAQAPGLERGWADFNARARVPRAKDRVFLFQHPAGSEMRFDNDDIADWDKSLRAVVPDLRFLHYVNSVHGSSGAPCFDEDFALFGLHQGEWTNHPNGDRVTNRGVPIARVQEHVHERIKTLPPLDAADNPIWEFGPSFNPRPVLGTTEFQNAVWRSAAGGPDAPKILRLTGARGSGKSFRLDLLSAMLPDRDHRKVLLTADAIAPLGAAELAAKICEAVGTAPTFTPMADYHSTASAWLKDEIAPKVIAALRAARTGEIVWLLFKDLDRYKFNGARATELLLLLYGYAVREDWLRVVLDGKEEALPQEVELQTLPLVVKRVELSEIATYFRRHQTANGLIADGDGIKAQSQWLFGRYENALASKKPKIRIAATQQLADDVRGLANAYLGKTDGS